MRVVHCVTWKKCYKEHAKILNIFSVFNSQMLLQITFIKKYINHHVAIKSTNKMKPPSTIKLMSGTHPFS